MLALANLWTNLPHQGLEKIHGVIAEIYGPAPPNEHIIDQLIQSAEGGLIVMWGELPVGLSLWQTSPRPRPVGQITVLGINPRLNSADHADLLLRETILTVITSLARQYSPSGQLVAMPASTDDHMRNRLATAGFDIEDYVDTQEFEGRHITFYQKTFDLSWTSVTH